MTTELTDGELAILRKVLDSQTALTSKPTQQTATKVYGENWVVLQNRLLNAISDLSLNERRLIMFLSPLVRKAVDIEPSQKAFFVSAKDFAKEYNISDKTVYRTLETIAKTLHGKVFYIWLWRGNTKNERGISWVAECEYLPNQGGIEIELTSTVVEMLTVFDKANPFTKYERQMITSLGSYGIILFELIASCMHQQHKQKSYTIEYLREKFNCVDKYNVISEFKRNVLDSAIKDIEKHTPYRITYKQVKTGRIVSDIVFSFENIDERKVITKTTDTAKENTIDLFSGLTDKQLERIARNKLFIADYNHMITPQSNANNDMNEWVRVMVAKMKTDIKLFSKKPLNDYLK